jgi:hypothetical protein
MIQIGKFVFSLGTEVKEFTLRHAIGAFLLSMLAWLGPKIAEQVWTAFSHEWHKYLTSAATSNASCACAASFDERWSGLPDAFRASPTQAGALPNGGFGHVLHEQSPQ